MGGRKGVTEGPWVGVKEYLGGRGWRTAAEQGQV